MMNLPIGLEGLAFVIIAIVIVVLYIFATVYPHVRVERLSNREVGLLVLFTSTLSMLVGLLIGGAWLFALVLFILFVIASILLFWTRARRWWLERALRQAVKNDTYNVEREVR